MTDREANLLPLILDLTNPSPAIGWANQERESALSRARPDAILALALIHHLAIGNNVPFEALAEFLAGLCGSLIIEFIPKEDVQVQRMLASRTDVFPRYTRRDFEETFALHFSTRRAEQIEGSSRWLYLMESKKPDKAR